jgi:tetratricopeptide (TPR) repeat protein
MTAQLQQPPAPWPSTSFAIVGRYALLVPEAPLLVLLLALHLIAGYPPLTALLGVGAVLWFVTRMGLLARARHLIASADYARAERALRVALWLHPCSADTYTLLGMLSLARGHADGAISALQQAARYFPLHSNLHAMISGALLEDDDPEAAFSEARQAVDLDPQNASAYLHLASAEQALGVAPDLAERHLRTGLDRCNEAADEAALRCALAAMLIDEGRLGEAQLALVGMPSLLERCPPAQRAGLHFHLGELFRQIGEQELARSHYSASEHLDPHGRYAAAAWRAARM